MGDTAFPTETSSGWATQSIRDILVLGLGNMLPADDGVGVHVVRHIASDPDAPAGLRPLDGGTPGFRLLAERLAARAVIVVDEAQLGEPAGTIRLLDQPALASHVRHGGRISAHEAGQADPRTVRAWRVVT